MGVISLSLRGSGESEYPQVTTLGGMREARNKAKGAGTRRYRGAKHGKVVRCKAELGESGMRVIARLNGMLGVRCDADMTTRANCY
jgi:hypothetical protein